MKQIVFLSCLAGFASYSAAAQTSRTVRGFHVWPELQAELALKNGDYLLLALHGERDVDMGSTNSAGALGLDMRRVMLSYEHFWSTRWSGGATLRYDNYGGYNYLIPELLLRHRSPVAGFTFGQRLSLERRIALFPDELDAGSGSESQNWVRLRVDVEKIYSVGGIALRPRLSYEAATHLRLQKEEGDTEERTIQYTSLRGEIGFRFSPRFDLTPWFAYRTDYLETLPQYNALGEQTSGGKLNVIRPTVGLEARFTLLPGKGSSERQQLPTQH